MATSTLLTDHPAWTVRPGFGAVLTGVAAVVVTATKFTEGAWPIVLSVPLLVAAFEAVHRSYARVGAVKDIGRIPEVPHRDPSLVVVPVASLSRLTGEALAAAMSLGDEVQAVTVTRADDEERSEALRRDWALWSPGVPLTELPSPHRDLGRPRSAYVRALAAERRWTRITVLAAGSSPAAPGSGCC